MSVFNHFLFRCLFCSCPVIPAQAGRAQTPTELIIITKQITILAFWSVCFCLKELGDAIPPLLFIHAIKTCKKSCKLYFNMFQYEEWLLCLCWLSVSLPAVRASNSFQPLVCPSHDSVLTTWDRNSESTSRPRHCRTGSSGSYPYHCESACIYHP